MIFVDGGGDPMSYEVTGNPGMKASLEASIEQRIGDVVGFFVHDAVANSGSNTVYRLVGMRFARVMGVRFQGAQAQRGLWVQPVTYVGPDVITIPGAPSSDGVAGKILLAR